MHELHLVDAILQKALHRAQEEGANRIVALHLALGEESSVSREAVQFYWEQVSPGTAAEGAALHFRPIRAQWQCADCGAPAPLGLDGPPCSACASGRVRAVAGDEFFLEAIDVEPGAAPAEAAASLGVAGEGGRQT